MSVEQMRAELDKLKRANARMSHVQSLAHDQEACELCALESSRDQACERLALMAQVVQERSINRVAIAQEIRKLGGNVDIAVTYPLGEPKALAKVRQAAIHISPTAPMGSASIG